MRIMRSRVSGDASPLSGRGTVGIMLTGLAGRGLGSAACIAGVGKRNGNNTGYKK